MLLLPRELILYISQFTTVDDIVDNNLFLEKSRKHNYPMRNLYATCKEFCWMSDLECVYLSCGEYQWNIITTDINGKWTGMLYDLCIKGINGYIYYVNGKMIRENIKSISQCDCEYRYINGWQFTEQCNQWQNQPCNKNCCNCDNFYQIQNIVYDKDPLIKELHGYNKDGVIIAENLVRFKFGLELIKKHYRGVDGFSILRQKRSKQFIDSLGF